MVKNYSRKSLLSCIKNVVFCAIAKGAICLEYFVIVISHQFIPMVKRLVFGKIVK